MSYRATHCATAAQAAGIATVYLRDSTVDVPTEGEKQS